MSVKRRDIVAGAAALATGAGIVGALRPQDKSKPKSKRSDNLSAPNLSQNRREYRMATSWPKDFPGLGQMPNRFAAALREMSEGRIDVKVFAAGELVGATECFDATSTGAADMYHAAEYYWQGKSRGFSFFTAIPLGMTAAEIMGWIDFGGGQALWDELSAKFNIKAFQAGNTGHQTGGWFKRKMESLDDFKGLRMRMPERFSRHWARPLFCSPGARFIRRYNLDQSMQQNGLAPGMIWHSVFIVKPLIIIHRAFMNPAPLYRSG